MYKLKIGMLSLVLILIGCVGLVTFGSSPLWAQMKGLDFNENIYYDIYFAYAVVKGIRIQGLKEIQGERFLVVSTTNLKTKDTEGYILFDTIKAILPTGYINVNAFEIPYQP